MNEQDAIAKMVSPRDPRPSIWRKGVLQIWVTRACDKACFGCTQGSNLGGKPGMITLEQFEQACVSLASGPGQRAYFGVIGIFGGNPGLHPKFADLCAILRKHIPWEQRGLWCNNPAGKGQVMRETFNPAVSNLNVHLDLKAYEEFKRDWPECAPYLKGHDSDSRHAPPYVALMDINEDESSRWDLISDCDINKYWSAMVGVFRGELRGYFCEIAAAQAMLHQHEPDYPDLGVPVVPGWWDRPIQDFAEQIKYHCHRCGIPLKMFGELAIGGDHETVSKTHAEVYRPKDRNRKVQLVQLETELTGRKVVKATDYLENGGLV